MICDCEHQAVLGSKISIYDEVRTCPKNDANRATVISYLTEKGNRENESSSLFTEYSIFNRPVRIDGNLPGFHSYTICNVWFGLRAKCHDAV